MPAFSKLKFRFIHHRTNLTKTEIFGKDENVKNGAVFKTLHPNCRSGTINFKKLRLCSYAPTYV